MTESWYYQDWNELLRRVGAVEQSAAMSAANALPNATGSVSSGLPIPTGLTLGKAVGGLSFFWTAVHVDIAYYEIQIDTSSSFASPETYRSVGPEYVYGAEDAEANYYARVRSVVGNDVSGWSASLNLQTGVAGFGDMEDDAATNIVENRTTTFTPASISSGVPNTGTYGSATIAVREGEVVFPFTTSRGDYAITGAGVAEGGVKVELVRDGLVVGDSFIQTSTSSTSGTISVSGFTTPERLSAGTYTYSVRFTAEGTALLDYTPTFLNIELVGFRQG